MAIEQGSKKRRKSEFRNLRIECGLSVTQCAEIMGVTERSVQNWDGGKATPLAVRFLKLYQKRDLSMWGNEWRGFTFSRGAIQFGRDIRLGPEQLKRWSEVVAVANRVDAARVRVLHGEISADKAVAIALGIPSTSSHMVTTEARKVDVLTLEARLAALEARLSGGDL